MYLSNNIEYPIEVIALAIIGWEDMKLVIILLDESAELPLEFDTIALDFIGLT
jgi:hypothetical protein